MEKIYYVVLSFFVAASMVACNSSPLKYDKGEGIKVNSEFEQSVKITQSAPNEIGNKSGNVSDNPSDSNSVKGSAKVAGSSARGKDKAPSNKDLDKGMASKASAKSSQDAKPAKLSKAEKSGKVDKAEAVGGASAAVKVTSTKHEPDLEDGAGFIGRRPIKDPFVVGESVVHEVSYFGVTAGHLSLKVEPFVNVNGRKSYTFATEIKTVGTFSSFYTADDRAETLVDYETLVPSVFALHVKESGQLREAKAHFDAKTLKATYWEHKYTKKDGDEEKKLQWDILEYSQNVFSAIFYMRVFQWEIGKENSFRVADDGENIVFKAKALRKELLKTDAGEFSCVVVKPEITVKGAFRPVGDIYVWITDDDRKLVLRIESKIKIGTLVSEAIKIERGNP